MLTQSFEYFVPQDLRDALSFLEKHSDECKIVAGGTDLNVLLKDNEISPKYLLDISLLKELDYLRRDELSIEIGPLTTHRVLSESEILAGRAIVLREACGKVGTLQIRNMGTIAGNIVNASPCADCSLALLSLGASLTLSSNRGGQRTVSIDEFFVHVNKTILLKDELLTAISIRKVANNSGGAFVKVGRRIGHDISITSCATTLALRDGTCDIIRLAFGSVAPTPIRSRKAEESLVGKRLTEDNIEEASEIAAGEVRPITDIRASEQYRRAVSKRLARRAILAATMRAGG